MESPTFRYPPNRLEKKSAARRVTPADIQHDNSSAPSKLYRVANSPDRLHLAIPQIDPLHHTGAVLTSSRE